jgi:hypothetical protein
MTWTLTAVREQVSETLAAGGIDCVAYLPESPNPPVVLIGAGDPWVQEVEDPSIEEYGRNTTPAATVRLELTLIAGLGSSESMQITLDELASMVWVLLRPDWTMETLSQPFQLDVANALYLASKVSVTAQIDLKEV